MLATPPADILDSGPYACAPVCPLSQPAIARSCCHSQLRPAHAGRLAANAALRLALHAGQDDTTSVLLAPGPRSFGGALEWGWVVLWSQQPTLEPLASSWPGARLAPQVTGNGTDATPREQRPTDLGGACGEDSGAPSPVANQVSPPVEGAPCWLRSRARRSRQKHALKIPRPFRAPGPRLRVAGASGWSSRGIHRPPRPQWPGADRASSGSSVSPTLESVSLPQQPRLRGTTARAVLPRPTLPASSSLCLPLGCVAGQASACRAPPRQCLVESPKPAPPNYARSCTELRAAARRTAARAAAAASRPRSSCDRADDREPAQARHATSSARAIRQWPRAVQAASRRPPRLGRRFRRFRPARPQQPSGTAPPPEGAHRSRQALPLVDRKAGETPPAAHGRPPGRARPAPRARLPRPAQTAASSQAARETAAELAESPPQRDGSQPALAAAVAALRAPVARTRPWPPGSERWLPVRAK